MSFHQLPIDDPSSLSGDRSGSTASYNELIRPDDVPLRRLSDIKRRTFLAASLFTLVVFVVVVVVFGIFYLKPSCFSEDRRHESELVLLNSDDSKDRMIVFKPQVHESSTTSTRSHAKLVPITVRTSTVLPSPATTLTSKGVVPELPSTYLLTNASESPPITRSIDEVTTTTTVKLGHPTLGTIKLASGESEEHDDQSNDLHELIPFKSKRSRNSDRARTPPTLPPNPEAKSPVSLLYEMALGPVFEYFVCASNQQHYKTVVTVRSKSYTGYGLGKKKSKKLAAQVAATEIFQPNVNYTNMANTADIRNMAVSCGLDSIN